MYSTHERPEEEEDEEEEEEGEGEEEDAGCVSAPATPPGHLTPEQLAVCNKDGR